MSTPIHHPDDPQNADPLLDYAPRWARRRGRDRAAEAVAAPPVELAEPPQAGAADGWQSSFSGDRLMPELQRRLARYPDQVPQPPVAIMERNSVWPLALRLFAVAGFAALVAWGMVLLPNAGRTSRSAAKAPPKQSVAIKAGETPPPARLAQEPAAAPPAAPDRIVPIAVRTASIAPGAPLMTAPDEPRRPDAAPPAAAIPAGAVGPAAATPSAPQPAPADAAAPTQAGGDAGAVKMDADEIATLLKRGKAFLTDGDIAAARILLQRAAEAGSAEAAMALGGTYDPLALQRLGVIGEKADVAQARHWYQKAAELGATTALEQIAKLDQAGQ